MENYDLNEQFELFLSRMKFNRDIMPAVQYTELKRAFYAGCSQMMLLFRDGIGAIEDEEKALAITENLFAQTCDFWINEING